MDMFGKNGELSGFQAMHMLYSELFFFLPAEIQYDGKNHKIVGIQVNSEKLPANPDIQKLQMLAMNIVECMQFAEANPKLMRNLSDIKPNIRPFVRKENLTAITLIDLASTQLLRIHEITDDCSASSNTKVIGVVVDTRISKGIPEFDALIEELIHTLLRFTDDDTDDLQIQQIGMHNLDR